MASRGTRSAYILRASESTASQNSRALAVKRGRIEHLNIEELEVGRLRVRELIVEQRAGSTPSSTVRTDYAPKLIRFSGTLGRQREVEVTLG
jgi:hypothetical protein